MFDGIPFTHTETTHPLSNRLITEETMRKGTYDPDNLLNAEFRIEGATDAFLRPPIAEFAKEHLFHMQAFNIFYYKKVPIQNEKTIIPFCCCTLTTVWHSWSTEDENTC